jgi:hypothetical protein
MNVSLNFDCFCLFLSMSLISLTVIL